MGVYYRKDYITRKKVLFEKESNKIGGLIVEGV